MPQERQWSSEWLPVELQDDEHEGTDRSEAAGADEGANAFLPPEPGAEPEPASDEAEAADAAAVPSGEPAAPVKKGLPEPVGPGYQPKSEEQGGQQGNGGAAEDWRLDRLMERADRAKTALNVTGDRGDEVDERVRAAAAEASMALVREAQSRAQDAAVTADRLAAKVADLTERLAEQDKELHQLGNATEVAERLSGQIESLSERLAAREDEVTQLREQSAEQQASHERELAQLREEVSSAQRQQSDPEPQKSETEAGRESQEEAEVSHQPREPAHRRQQTEAAPLDLNKVGFEELCAIGFSVKQAARLIGYREQRGGFQSADDPDRLSGMPEKTIEALKNAAGG